MKPAWLRTTPPSGEKFLALSRALKEYNLNTVCTGSKCPNLGDCWSRGCAAIMIMGSMCTRNCRFCAVKKGRTGEPLDSSEPERIFNAVKNLGLRYVALTSVDRDDLSDYGAGHFANCLRAVKSLDNVTVEALIPDFKGNLECLRKVAESKPDILGHNIEVVEELQSVVRDRKASYDLSLKVLVNAKRFSSSYIKSSLMLGLGETEEMVLKTLKDLRNAGVEIITLGQYLRPSEKHLEVRQYISPEKFAFYKKKAEEMGFISVMSGPFVRSSYMAEDMLLI